jgi:hypothetical protein
MREAITMARMQKAAAIRQFNLSWRVKRLPAIRSGDLTIDGSSIESISLPELLKWTMSSIHSRTNIFLRSMRRIPAR